MKNAAEIRLLILDCDGTLTDGLIVYNDAGSESKHFSAKDGLGLHLAHLVGLDIAIITGRFSEMLARRCQDLHITHLLQKVSNKRLAADELLLELGLQWSQVAVVGDDWNDLPIMEPAAISACPSDAFPTFMKRVDVVLERRGGDGAVREFVERLLLARNQYDEAVDRLLDVLRSH
jgi:3-deoxy-D-manno-octulosonate 8-phosphate phosphatase (KDO 8-P phosphatase)